MRWVLALVLVGCDDPEPGEPGYQGCDPVPIERQCLVWSCYHVWNTRGSVDFWYEFQSEESGTIKIECDEYDCTEAYEEAVALGCP